MSLADNFAKAIAKAQILIQILPLISGFVQQVENMFPTGGAGATKLEAVRKLLESVYEEMGDIGVTFTELWPSLSKAVAAIVAAANALGLFKKSAQTAP